MVAVPLPSSSLPRFRAPALPAMKRASAGSGSAAKRAKTPKGPEAGQVPRRDRRDGELPQLCPEALPKVPLAAGNIVAANGV